MKLNKTYKADNKLITVQHVDKSSAVISVKEYYKRGVKTYNDVITLDELESVKRLVKKYNTISK